MGIFNSFIKSILLYTIKYNLTQQPVNNFHSIFTTVVYLNLNKAYHYNIEVLYTIIYTKFCFLYNAGQQNASFAVIGSKHTVELKAILYQTLSIQQRHAFFKLQLESMHKVIQGGMLYLKFLKTLDFIILLDITLKSKDLVYLYRANVHILGITLILGFERYIDTIIPIETNSIELQLICSEFILYAYLYGKRANITRQFYIYSQLQQAMFIICY
jgi:hypothetical protein